MSFRSNRRRPRGGFTLLELLVVLAIIAALAAVVAPSIFSNVGSAKMAAAKAQMETFELSLTQYRLDNDAFPSTEQGLSALRDYPTVPGPNGELPRNWRGPYLSRLVPLDPWGRPYLYVQPGLANPSSYDLVSLGRDGREGGAGVTRTHYTATSFGNTDWVEGSVGHRTQYGYDAAGHLNLVTDALGHSTSSVLDALGRTQLTVGPRADTTRFTYDSLFLWKVTDANGQVYRYDHNTLGWVDSLTDPGLRTEHFTYDKNGNVTTYINRRAQTVSTTYDTLDRPLQVIADPHDTTRFAYDFTDRWFAVSNAASTDTTNFDVAGRSIAEISLRPHVPTALRFATVSQYSDPTGVRQRLDWDTALGHSVVWDYDAALQLQDILTHGGYTTLGYNSDRQASTVTFPNGVTQSNSYSSVHGRTLTTFAPVNSAADLAFQVSMHEDSLGRTTERYRHPLANSADTSRVYSYDAAGQLTRYQDKVSDGKTCTQGPDHGETCTISNPQTIAEESYSYDLVGNRTDSAGTIAAGNRVQLFHGYSLGYDADGNLVSKSKGGVTDSLFWDALGQLTRVRRTGVDVASYTYDGMGRRISKTTAGGTTLYQWDDQNVVAERDGTGAIVTEYAFYPGVDHPNSITTGDSTYFVATEPPGNIIGLMSPSGSGVQSVYRYRPFGTMERDDQNTGNSLRFQGRPYDAETGLYYFRARYYDPQLSRFVSEDPIGLDGGINPYEFAQNDPINSMDPSGLSSLNSCQWTVSHPAVDEHSDETYTELTIDCDFGGPSGENPNPSDRGATGPVGNEGSPHGGGGGSTVAKKVRVDSMSQRNMIANLSYPSVPWPRSGVQVYRRRNVSKCGRGGRQAIR